jgi:hypothetical protein
MDNIKARDARPHFWNSCIARFDCARFVVPSASALGFILVLAVIAGPLLSGTSVGLSPYHAHVFYLGDASSQQYVGTELDHDHGAENGEVVSLFDHSGGSNSIPLHATEPPGMPGEVSLASSVISQPSELPYADALSRPPEHPPRTA